MGLLDGDLAAIFDAAFSGFYLDAELYRPTDDSDDGEGGGDGSGFGEPESVKAQLDTATQAMRERQGYVDTDARILVLAQGVDRPTTDCEIAVSGTRYGIRNVGTDPAQSYWDLHGRLSGNAEAGS